MESTPHDSPSAAAASPTGTGAGPTRLATGIELLDRKLDGGVPAGSITAVLAPPASQSELLLYELATARPTLYLTSVRAAEDVRETFSRLAFDESDVEVVAVDPADPVDDVLELIESLPSPGTLILDAIEPFETLPAQTYWAFLNELRARLSQADAVCFLHCLDGRAVAPLRDSTEYLADLVFRMETTRRGDRVENSLSVPKYRGGQALEDVVKLSLTTGVDVDVSRNLV